jgi:hypothetical protein
MYKATKKRKRRSTALNIAGLQHRTKLATKLIIYHQVLFSWIAPRL